MIWHGASLEPGGMPDGSILRLPGISRLSPSAGAALLSVSRELGIPVDSLATVISRESGFRSDALNPLPAAGLIQITAGAHLPGFDTPERIREVSTWTAERQIREVVRPYYARIAGARGADPGKLYMLNFLPSDANKPGDFRLGDSEGDSWRQKVYELNSGFDHDDKGYFTIDDVLADVARTVESASGRVDDYEGPYDGRGNVPVQSDGSAGFLVIGGIGMAILAWLAARK